MLMITTSLQLSTSICMPFNPYRPHRFPDPISRSRFPVNASIPNIRTMPASTLPPKAWRAPLARNDVYHPPHAPLASVFSDPDRHQRSVASSQAIQIPVAMDLEASYFQTCLTPEKQIMNDPWDQGTDDDTDKFLYGVR